MRVLVDTNVLFSALLFPRSKPAQVLLHVARNHEIVRSFCVTATLPNCGIF